MSEQENNKTVTPKTWLLLSDKLGDNAQVNRVADELPWPVETRSLVFLEQYRLGKPDFEASLYHVDLALSDDLEAPWPDLILTIGRRPAMVAQWIRKQSQGKTKVVLFGRPKVGLRDYDLVIAPGQYHLPQSEHIFAINLPLMRVDEERLRAARETWQERLETMKKPLIAVLVGGTTKPFDLTERAGKELAQEALAIADSCQGSLYFTTSRRTQPEAIRALREVLPEAIPFFEFTPSGGENPFMGLMACADRFIVTGDSVSMMVEVAGLGKPLAIYELPLQRGLRTWLDQKILRFCHQEGAPFKFLSRFLQARGLMGYPRDLTLIHKYLYDCGAARPLRRGFPADGAMIGNDVGAVSQRIQQLMD